MPSWRYDDDGDVVVDTSWEASTTSSSDESSEPETETVTIKSRSQTCHRFCVANHLPMKFFKRV